MDQHLHCRHAPTLFYPKDQAKISAISPGELLAIPGFRASMKRSLAQMKRGDTLSLEEVLGDDA